MHIGRTGITDFSNVNLPFILAFFVVYLCLLSPTNGMLLWLHMSMGIQGILRSEGCSTP